MRSRGEDGTEEGMRGAGKAGSEAIMPRSLHCSFIFDFFVPHAHLFPDLARMCESRDVPLNSR